MERMVGQARPRMRKSHLPRPRMMTLLSEIPDFPVTVVKAGAGHGKTTAVAGYTAQSDLASGWITMADPRADGVGFVSQLLYACLPVHTPEHELERVLAAANYPVSWLASADLAADLMVSYVHQETIVILDDFHHADEDVLLLRWVERWLSRLPIQLHIVFVTRTNPPLSTVEQLFLRGEVLVIRERDLAFTEEEIGYLFQTYPIPTEHHLLGSQIRWLVERTGGTAIVLSMLLREWRHSSSFARLQELLDEQTSIQEQVGQLFFGDLRPAEQTFIRQAALLTSLTPDICDAVLHRSDSEVMLKEMERQGSVLLDNDGVTYRLHPLVREYLVHSLHPDERQHTILDAIAVHTQRGEDIQAIRYLFLLEDERLIASALIDYIPNYLERGQVSTVRSWLDRLSQETVAAIPDLLWAKGEVARHANQFTEALQFYQLARQQAVQEGNRRLTTSVELATARLYLDTIQPASANAHIRLARRSVQRADITRRVEILQVSFENAINCGQLTRARRLHILLQSLPAQTKKNNSDARLLLRTGQIREVIRTLRPRVAEDHVDHRTALSHREATLLLSLMYAMQGDVEQAKEQAMQGHSLGNYLHSPFVRAVGFIRLGHAQHLDDALGDAALISYQQAVSQMDELDIPRGKAEALLGMALAHGYRRQTALGRFYAQEGILVAERAGDTWMAALVRLGLGQILVEADAYEQAVDEFTRCSDLFGACGDDFLRTAARLWRALARFALADVRFHDDLAAALTYADQHDAQFLLTTATLTGLRDVQQIVPLLQAHRVHGEEPRLAVRVLHQLDAADLDYHPGYTLRVKTFGQFTAWRGFKEISRREWQREKAKLLFQFLLTYRGMRFHRDEICDRLWGDMSPEAAERDFKVALNVLSLALEPEKPGRGTTIFIERQGPLYSLTTHRMVMVDKDVFSERLQSAATLSQTDKRMERLKSALSLYQGDFLPELRYETWTEGERESLRCQFLQGSMQLAQLCLQLQQLDEVLTVSERAIAVDPVWEAAYASLMQAYSGLGNRPMVIATYRSCERILEQELGVPPMASTRELYEQLVGIH